MLARQPGPQRCPDIVRLIAHQCVGVEIVDYH